MPTYVWCAFAGDDSTDSEHLIGIYTTREKARGAVVEYFDLVDAQWDSDVPDRLDEQWLIGRTEDPYAYGYAREYPVE